MHQSRKTYNAHNETQRRLKKAAIFDYIWHKGPRHIKSRDNASNGYYLESRSSLKSFKKIIHRKVRRKNVGHDREARKLFKRMVAFLEDSWL